MNNKKILVLGAGVVGVSTALALYERGYNVEIVDQSAEVGQGASGNNGGQLSYNYTDALASPDTLKSLPKFLLGLDQAFRLKLSVDWDFLKWSLSFLRNSSADRADENTLAVLELALGSQRVLQKWRSDYGFDFDFRAAPKLHLFENEQKLAASVHRVELKNRHGANQSIVSRKQALEIEPSLNESRVPFIGGVYSPDEEVGDVVAFVKEVLTFLQSTDQVTISLGDRISKVLFEGGNAIAVRADSGEREFDGMVICAGYQSSKFAKSIGIPTPIIQPVAGYSLTYPIGSAALNASITDTASRMVYCRLGDQIRIAGMADVGRIGPKPESQRIEILSKLAKERFPHVADYTGSGSPWMGVRPMTASSRPVIEQTSIPNIYINSGHGMLGWTLAPSSAIKLADIVERSQ